MGGKGKGKGKGDKGKGKVSASKGVGKGKSKGKDETKWVKKMPTVLVTGASGFIAGNIILTLLAKGYTVRGTVRSLSDAEKVSHLTELFPGIELFEADLLKGEEGFTKAAQGCEFILHTASPFQLSVSDPQRDLIDPAVKGTEAVMKAAKAASVKRVVVTSSCAAIGPPQTWMATPEEADKEKVFTEEDWNTTSTLEAGPYRLSKRMAEEKAVELGKEFGIEVVAICPSFVLGPPLSKRTDGESVKLIQKMLNGDLRAAGPCGGPVGMGCVDVRDLAFGHVAAMEHPEAAGKRFIMSSSEGVSIFELAQMLETGFKAYTLPTEGKELVYRSKYSSALANSLLKVYFRPVAVSVTNMAAALIKLGIVDYKVLLTKTKFGKVMDLNPESKSVNLLLKVVSCKTLEEKERGESVVETVAGDATGIVTLRTAESVEVGKIVAVRNALVRMTTGYIRVHAGKWGKIAEEASEEEIVPKTDFDVSATEYEQVTN